MIDDNYEILDGTHRVAVAQYFGDKVIKCDVFKNSPVFVEWTGETALMSRKTIWDLALTNEEIKAIENIYQFIKEKR